MLLASEVKRPCNSVCIPNRNERIIFIFTGRNEVVAKVIFLHLFVILFTGGCLPQCMLGNHTRAREAESGIRSMSGRYASYWNAFLFHSVLKSNLSMLLTKYIVLHEFEHYLKGVGNRIIMPSRYL